MTKEMEAADLETRPSVLSPGARLDKTHNGEGPACRIIV